MVQFSFCKKPLGAGNGLLLIENSVREFRVFAVNLSNLDHQGRVGRMYIDEIRPGLCPNNVPTCAISGPLRHGDYEWQDPKSEDEV